MNTCIGIGFFVIYTPTKTHVVLVIAITHSSRFSHAAHASLGLKHRSPQLKLYGLSGMTWRPPATHGVVPLITNCKFFSDTLGIQIVMKSNEEHTYFEQDNFWDCLVAEWVKCSLSTRETWVRSPLIPPRGQRVVFLVIEFQSSVWFGFHIKL